MCGKSQRRVGRGTTAKTGGSPRCERARTVSTIAKDNRIPEPHAAHFAHYLQEHR
jgi:hypothetical protein